MHLVKQIGAVILLSTILACLLLAQSPIGFGPGTLGEGLLKNFDWYSATPSGCTPSAGPPAKMCVGALPNGDGYYLTGWMSSSSLLPSGTGLPIIGSFTSGHTTNCSGNIGIFQLGALDWSNLSASYWYEVNCMSGYGVEGDTPAGWFGHCISSTSNDGCTWKSRNVFVRDGTIYNPIERALEVGTPSIHDMSLVMSPDGGRHWCNPYSLWHGTTPGTCDSTNWSATGAAPTCGAPDATHPCADASYTDGTHPSMMWKASTTGLTNWHAIQYGQDGITPPVTGDGCDPNTWTCFFGSDSEGTLARVLNTDLPSLDVSKWWYYTCPTASATYRCPSSDAASWTHSFSDRTVVVKPNMASFQGMAYFKDFGSYVLGAYACLPPNATCGDDGVNAGSGFFTSQKPEGPWSATLFSRSVRTGSTTPSLALSSTVTSNPPHVLMGTVTSGRSHAGLGNAVFTQWDLTLGRVYPIGVADESAKYYRWGDQWPKNSGLVLSDGHAPGTIPRKDLKWAFDFYDHGGLSTNDLVSAYTNSFVDIANGSAVIMGCHGSGSCANWNSGQGVTLQPFGVSIGDAGYSAYLTSALRDTPQTVAIGVASGLTPTNAPAAMQGNGTYTVAGVFRYDAGNNGTIWSTGGASLRYGTSGAGLAFAWGGNSLTSSFNLVAGNWYFICLTVTANGTSPTVHAWVGDAGVLSDKAVGASRAGSTAPSVSAAPMLLGSGSSVSYAGLFVYSRALGQAEVGLMYATLKAKMAARGVTLQ